MDLSNFGDPAKRAFPVLNQEDLDNAARLIGHADNPAAVKKRLIAIAKRKGLTLPDAWKDEKDKPKEAATTTPTFKPKQRIARIKSYFIEDDAISLNGRQYPKEAVDRLIQSAQMQLSDPNALPLTCYLSHDKADQDSTRDISGKITHVGREGSKGYVLIDIPDTTAGRDAASLVAGGYIRSQSLRASGAEMKMDRERTFPQVGGSGLKLEGVDFTTSPGLSQVARITEIVTESHEPQSINEVFNAHPTTMILEDLPSMSTDLQEETISPLTSGDSVGMTNDDPRDDYSKRLYTMPPTAPTDQFPESMSDLSNVHDRLAYVMSMECGPDTMEAVRRFGTGVVLEREQLQEAGAKLSGSTKKHLMKAHDGVAGHLNMPCMGDGDTDADDKPGMGPGFSGAGMQPGEDSNMSDMDKEQHTLTRQDIERMVQEQLRKVTPPQQPQAPTTQKETKKPMTKEEAIRLLAESGYDVKAPKTKDELLQEAMDAKLAEQRKQMEDQQALISAQLEEMKKLLAERANPYAAHVQRKSLVEGATTTDSSKRPYYRNGDYIREKLNAEGMREQLLDRSRPLPADINPEHLLKELQLELLGMYDAVYGLEGNPKIFG
jgi:hypothetical protein